MQLTYAINQSAAQAGQLYDLSEYDFVSAVNPSADVPFGVALAQGAADGQCKLPAASGDIAKILGVAALVQTKEQPLPSASGPVVYKMGSDIALMRKGRIYVKVEEAVSAMDAVFIRFASGGGGTQLGAFRKSADTASAAQVSGAVYRTSAGANGFAVVEFNLPA